MFTGLLSSVSPGVIPHLPWIAGAAARGREETVGFRWLGLVEVARLVEGAHGEGGGRGWGAPRGGVAGVDTCRHWATWNTTLQLKEIKTTMKVKNSHSLSA